MVPRHLSGYLWSSQPLPFHLEEKDVSRVAIEFNHQGRTLDFALNLFERRPQSKVIDGPAEEQTGQQESTNSPQHQDRWAGYHL